ncbi:MAG: IclR family transcriptional regulator [Erysipelotrichaceae bacterium]|jgi:DNA-binding IclR family transcriptional regulator|nr:IclR family transcriptional regulator [Erysipelotrichaceae bacterium]
MKPSVDNRNNIKSIVKAAKIIDAIAFERRSMSLSELSDKVKIAKSTLHGLLSTLVNIGYIDQESDSGYYKLGVELFELGSQISSTWNEKNLAKSWMRRLAEEVNETVHLAMLSNGEVLYVDKMESTQSIRIETAPGVKLPAHCTGLGKVLLAYQPKKEFEHILDSKGMKAYTAKTITNRRLLERELAEIRQNGVGMDDQEFLDGLRCVAAPIFDVNGRILFALSISGPLFRMSNDALENYRMKIKNIGMEISEKLGYRSQKGL